MASFALSIVRAPVQDAVDEALEVGAVPRQLSATAMRSGVGGGTLVYLGEAPISVATVWRIVEHDQHRHRWWRLEAKVATKNNWIRAGDTLVVADHPYSSGWLQSAPFKPGSKKGALARPDLSRSMIGTEIDFLRAIEGLHQDYWEKGNHLTAGISEPDLPFDLTGRIRNTQRQALFVFGTCDDLALCERQLFQTALVQRLLRDTERGTIRFWAPKANLKTRPTLYDEVKADAPVLMTIAIRQALAGPHRDGEQWIGRPVVEKIAQIYRGHLNRCNRLVAKKLGKLSQYDDALDYGDVGDDFEERAWAAAGRY